MLYTRKGDNGTTKLFNCPEGTRLSKGSFVFEVLGTLDELNSSMGYAKALSSRYKNYLSVDLKNIKYQDIIEIFQQNIFSIQAELAGSDIHIKKEHILYLEKVIYEVDTVLPPIKSFVITGGGESSAYLDICRTIARRTERQLVSLKDKNERKINNESIIYLNRLSSALYALARFANYQEGYSESKPNYI